MAMRAGYPQLPKWRQRLGKIGALAVPQGAPKWRTTTRRQGDVNGLTDVFGIDHAGRGTGRGKPGGKSGLDPHAVRKSIRR